MVLNRFLLSARLWTALTVTAALGACATTPSTPELTVRERASQVWQAKVAGDYDKSYTFMPPSYRAVTPVATYKKAFGGAVRLVGAEVVSVRCESADKCIAAMKVEARPGLARANTAPIVSHFEEIWVREGSAWWLFPTS